MGKKKSWVNLVKRFFLFETPSKPEKKERRNPKWVFARLFRAKKLASIRAPSPPGSRQQRTLNEAEEEQKKQNLTAAIAAAAAAEVALAAAQIAAETVLLTCSMNTCKEETNVHPENITNQSHSFDDQIQSEAQETAAIRIQTTFRAYLAKKALRALKGIVVLQAIIRGRLVRRQAMATLKRLQSIVNIQSQVCNKRAEGSCHMHRESRQLQILGDKIIKVDTNSEKRWDGSFLTKEEVDAMILNRKKAAFKRERVKEYLYNHRKSAESEPEKGNGRMKYWLDQWVDTQLSRSKELEDLDSVWTSNQGPIKQLKLRIKPSSPRLNNTIGGILSSPTTVPGRTFHHRKQSSFGQENSFSISPLEPTYMAATASARAKVRSTSSPRQRTGSFDTQSESYSPCKNKLSLVTCDASISSRANACKQRSPTLKGISVPVKSSRMLKDLSFNSDCSLPIWDQSQRKLRLSF